MLYQLGSLTIQIAPFNISDVTRNSDTDFVFKPVLDAEPASYQII